MTASRWRKRVKELVRLKGPVSHRPAGTNSIPPPSEANWLRCVTAAENAAVLEVAPSPTPPKSARDAVWTRQAVAEYSNASTAPLPSPSSSPWKRLVLLMHSAGPVYAAIRSSHVARI
ncbi:hypothetical protein B296_00019912 [Ensete ventricosum]|uniref:Uncharacterized protein n=1 Tax=Ensete ventricosum TaxID=4639 RepID=A0A426Y7N7_ENSVE|nr:hypothetical protein B296_00019912 [Ensete ventricosum]